MIFIHRKEYINYSLDAIYSSFIADLKKGGAHMYVKDIEKAMNSIKRSSNRVPITNVYEHIINLPLDSYYEMVWNMDKVNDIIAREKIAVRTCRLKDLHINNERLDWNNVALIRTYKSIYPIITVDHPLIGRTLIIDGNHRVQVLLERGGKTVDVYHLDAQLSYEALVDGLTKHLYEFHCTMLTIIKQTSVGKRALLTHLVARFVSIIQKVLRKK